MTRQILVVTTHYIADIEEGKEITAKYKANKITPKTATIEELEFTKVYENIRYKGEE